MADTLPAGPRVGGAGGGGQQQGSRAGRRPRRDTAAFLLATVVLSAFPTALPHNETQEARRQFTVIDPPAIVSLVANDPTEADSIYSNGDTITITFDIGTDTAGLAIGPTQPRLVVDTLFTFSQALGSDYVGKWSSSRVFEITVLDWPGAAPPTVGPDGLTVQVISDQGRAIRADPVSVGLSTSSSSVSPRMTGDFGPSNVAFSSVTAAPPAGEAGDTYRSGSTITLVFNRATNKGFLADAVTKAEIDALLVPSASLGAAYTGQWTSATTLVITVQDATGAGPPTVGGFFLTVKPAGELRNVPAACAPSAAVSGFLQGDFGASTIAITEIRARDPANIDVSHSVNDTLTVTFNQDTNRAGFEGGATLTKAQVDSIFAFSDGLGADYTGVWVSRSSFVITARDTTGNAPPTPGFFSLRVRLSAGMRNFPPQSAPTSASSPLLVGNWGTVIPEITRLVASGAGGSDGAFDAGDTLTVSFSPNTNRANLPDAGLTKQQIDSILSFSAPLGADYTGAWADAETLVVTMVDVAGAGPPLRGVLTVTCVTTGVAPIRNIDQISDACFTTSPPCEGDFGPTLMTFTATAAGDASPVYSPGDTIDVAFTQDTDRGGYGAGVLSRAEVQQVFTFSQGLGGDFVGQWLTRRLFRITAVDVAGASPPTIDSPPQEPGLVVAVNATGNLRNFPPNSAPLEFTSAPLTGAFGPNAITLSALVASDPTGAAPVLNNGDKVTFVFSEATNMGGHAMGQLLTASQLDAIANFSLSLGRTIAGAFVSRTELEITCFDVRDNGVPVLGIFTAGIKASGNVRNHPPASAPIDAISPPLTGDFGPSPITVVSVVANDPVDIDDTLNDGDTLEITFSEPTDMGGTGGGSLTKAQVDLLFSFSDPLGADYRAEWLSNTAILITAIDTTGSGPPGIGVTTVAVLPTGLLRNTPPQCAPTSTISPVLSGDFGILYPGVSALVADDPSNRNSVYSFLDTITLTFSIPTNRAGLNNGDKLSRGGLLNQFFFSQNLGNSFTGEWVDARTLIITVEGTAGASPPTIGGLFVTCRTDTDALILNEVGTSRACWTASPPLTGDFGPSPITMLSLVAFQPGGQGYSVGVTLTVTYSDDTNMAGYGMGEAFSAAGLAQIFSFSARLGANYTGSWSDRRTLVITIHDVTNAGPPVPGEFTATMLPTSNVRNFPPQCASTEGTSPVLAGDFGPSTVVIESWTAAPPLGLTSCQGYVAGSTMTVQFNEDTNRAGFPRVGVTRQQLDALFAFNYNIGSDYTGQWLDDKTLVITITNPFGASPPQISNVVASVQAVANLRSVPPVTAASVATAPPMFGEFGPGNIAVSSFRASDPDNQDDVFGTGDIIDIEFSIPTNRAWLPTTGITRAQIDSLFTFSHSIGLDYTGAWLSNQALRITIVNGTEDPASALPYPPFVGLFGLKATVNPAADLRNSPATCGAADSVTDFLDGDFGPSRIRISSFVASTTVSDSVYGSGDLLTITFSERTNQGGYTSVAVLNQFQVNQIFNFSQSLGLAYQGRWVTESVFLIGTTDATGAGPPSIGNLVVTVLPGGDLRNMPPQSAPASFVSSAPVTGNFGPNPIGIVAFTAHDPLNTAIVYHAGVQIAVLFTERPTWKKQPIYHGQPLTMAEVDELLSFSAVLGSEYTGRWIIYDACPEEIYSLNPPFPGPPCRGVLVQVLNIAGNTNPTIGVLQVRVNAEGDVRNDPAQSAPAVLVSSPITGNWGITIPYVTTFFATPPLPGHGSGWNTTATITMTLSEQTNTAGVGVGVVLNKSMVDRQFHFDQSLGANYTGVWVTSALFVVTARDVTGAGPPEVGVLTVQIIAVRGLQLKNVGGDSKPANGRYMFLNGVWGLTGSWADTTLAIANLTATARPGGSDDTWAEGDSLVVDLTEPTNKGCYEGCDDVAVSQARVFELFQFTDAMWTPLAVELGPVLGQWSSEGSQPCTSCSPSTAGECKARASFDSVKGIYVDTFMRDCAPVDPATGLCPGGYQLCNSRQFIVTRQAGAATSRPPTIGGLRASILALAQLRNYPASTPPASGGDSPLLSGAFGPPCISIASLAASDPANIDGRFGPSGDVLTIDFNQDTNMAGASLGAITRQQADSLLEYRCVGASPCPDFALDYSAEWQSRSRLVITVTNASNVYPFDPAAPDWRLPIPGRFTVAVRPGNDLRNFPPACEPNAPTSPLLSGDFGPSNIALTELRVRDPLDLNDVYGNDDTVILTFSQDTDYAGRGQGPWPKAAVDQVFNFSSPLGLDYSGVWITRSTFTITVHEVGNHTPPLDGFPLCCEGNFSAQVLASGDLRQHPPTSGITETCGGPGSCLDLSVAGTWGQCSFVGEDLSASCERLVGNYGRPYPRLQSLVGDRGAGANGTSAYRDGVELRVQFTELVQMGACSTEDALPPPQGVSCNRTVGTCSITDGADAAAWEAACSALSAPLGAVWRPASLSPYPNCQLSSVDTEAGCAAVPNARWTHGSAPHMTCTVGDASTSAVDCLALGGAWRVHETWIPKRVVDLIFEPFSASLGQDYHGVWHTYGVHGGGVADCPVPCALDLTITVDSAAGAGPPEMDLFTVRTASDRGVAVRDRLGASPPSTSTTPPMSGDFGPATVVLTSLTAGGSHVWASNPGHYQDYVTLTARFDRPTNRALLPRLVSLFGLPIVYRDLLNKEEVDSLFDFDRVLGADYVGEWTNCTVHPGKEAPGGCSNLVINVTNVTGATPPTVHIPELGFGLEATLKASAGLRDYPAGASPSSGRSGDLRGDFGPSGITVVLLESEDSALYEPGVSTGDTLTLRFSERTDRGGVPLGTPVGTDAVDALLNFSVPLADNYTGVWADNETFVLTVGSPNASFPPPIINLFRARVLPSGLLRNYPPTSAPTDTASVPLTGGWGPSPVYVVSIFANDADDGDSVYGPDDTITITFNLATQRGGMPAGVELPKEEVDRLFNFSDGGSGVRDMGRNYTGVWHNDSVFVLTVRDSWVPISEYYCNPKETCDTECQKCALVTDPVACQRTLPDSSIPDAVLNQGTADCPSCASPQVNQSDLTGGYLVNEGTAACANCPRPLFNWVSRGICEFSSNGNYRPPQIFHDLIRVFASANLRENPPVNLPTAGIDYSGRSPPAVLLGDFGPSDVNVSALVGGDPDGADSVYGTLDTLTVVFTVDTDMAQRAPGDPYTQAEVDTLLTFSGLIGDAYNGTWLDRRRFMVTVTDSTGHSNPTLGQFFVRTNKEGWVRNYPAVSGPTVSEGNAQEPRVCLSGDFGPSSIYIRGFVASSPNLRSDRYAVGAAFTVYFNERTNRGDLPVTGLNKSMIDGLLHFYSDVHDPHPVGVDYVGEWLDGDTALRVSVTVVDFNSFTGPPPIGEDNFRVSVKPEGNLRNFPPQCAPTHIDADNKALAGIQRSRGDGDGLNCDCCTGGCGDCEVCDTYSCGRVEQGDLLVDFCRDCCLPYGPDNARCCRILSGNYGKIVRLYEIFPRVIDTVSQEITIFGHGFAGTLRFNTVSVGGVNCPIRSVDISQVTLDGNLTCQAPSGVGSDVMPIIILVREGGFSDRIVEGLCCSEFPETDINSNGLLPPQGDGRGGVTYRNPAIFSLVPPETSFLEGQVVTVVGRYFGLPELFPRDGPYAGPVGLARRREDYTPPRAMLAMRGRQVAQCLETDHRGDRELVCRTPEMISGDASLVVEASGGESPLWGAEGVLRADQLPRFKYDCPAERTGRCFDCCEEACQVQFEGQGFATVPDAVLEWEGFHAFCSQECWGFCGFREVDRVAAR